MKTQIKSFILGYLPEDDVTKENLREFKDKITANWEAEEWVEVFAVTLNAAKNKYEKTFLAWQKNPY